MKNGGQLIQTKTFRGMMIKTTGNEIPLPEVTTEQYVEIAVRVSLLVCDDKKYVKWANNWLSGKDRSAKAAYSAANTTNDAAHNAAHAANTIANIDDTTCNINGIAHAIRYAVQAGVSAEQILQIIADVVGYEEE